MHAHTQCQADPISCGYLGDEDPIPASYGNVTLEIFMAVKI